MQQHAGVDELFDTWLLNNLYTKYNLISCLIDPEVPHIYTRHLTRGHEVPLIYTWYIHLGPWDPPIHGSRLGTLRSVTSIHDIWPGVMSSHTSVLDTFTWGPEIPLYMVIDWEPWGPPHLYLVNIGEGTWKIIFLDDFVYCSLKTGHSIGYTKWNPSKLIQIAIGSKSSIWLVCHLQWNLVICTL